MDNATKLAAALSAIALADSAGDGMVKEASWVMPALRGIGTAFKGVGLGTKARWLGGKAGFLEKFRAAPMLKYDPAGPMTAKMVARAQAVRDSAKATAATRAGLGSALAKGAEQNAYNLTNAAGRTGWKGLNALWTLQMLKSMAYDNPRLSAQNKAYQAEFAKLYDTGAGQRLKYLFNKDPATLINR